ncbi:hypothetical protein FBU59_000209 [Linderina macrospora]|uniref:Uncharacterized protein n=1 Tax=Linderina macrospora TaxID=4868 RepID=A0ACC1JH94_9FUNG|nr:hypothetical protein FBU59_000209 [Linderina macrospora]
MSFKTTITKLFSTKSDAKSVTSVETVSLKTTASTISDTNHNDLHNTAPLSASKGGRPEDALGYLMSGRTQMVSAVTPNPASM